MERTLRLLRERTGSARIAPDVAAGRARGAVRRAGRGGRPGRRRPRAHAAARAGGRPPAQPARGGRARRRARARAARMELRPRGGRARSARARGRRARGERPRRPDRRRSGGSAVVRDYKGRTVHPARALGAGAAPPGRAVPARRARAARPRAGGRRSTSRSAGPELQARGLVREGLDGGGCAPTWPTTRRSRRRWSRRARGRRGGAGDARRRGRAVPRPVRLPRLRVPDDLPGGEGGPVTARRAPSPPFTRRAARRDRRAHGLARCSPPTPGRARPR